MADGGGDWRLRLAVLLSIVSGMVDLLGFVGLGKIFTAHITGNLVMIPASFFATVNVIQVAVLPVFIAAVAATWFLSKMSGKQGPMLARYTLTFQFLLLCAVFILSVTMHPSTNQRGVVAGVMALIAVCAMASQHSLLRIANAPSTAVMTGNLTNAVLSLLDALALHKKAPLVKDARERLRLSVYLLMGFVGGCVIAAFAFHWLGDWAWLFPAALAGGALAIPVDDKAASSNIS